MVRLLAFRIPTIRTPAAHWCLDQETIGNYVVTIIKRPNIRVNLGAGLTEEKTCPFALESQLELSIDARIKSLVSLCERQIIAERSLILHLTYCAAYSQFFDHLELVPERLFPQLREVAQQAPPHPEDSSFVLGLGWSTGSDADPYNRASREQYYWGSRNLREYFYPGLALPHFELIKLIGVVEEVVELDGSIVLFGDIDTMLVRDNPIELITPFGTKIRTTVIRCESIRRDRDAQSSEWQIREFGQFALILADSIKSIAEAPVGTEVWVDRTAVAEVRRLE